MTIARLLGVVGIAALAITAAWWWIVFRQVIDNGYMSIGNAMVCIGANSAACDLAMALCGAKHPFGVDTYSTVLFWLALTSLLTGIAAGTYSRLSD